MPLLDFLFPKHSLRGGEGEWITASERAWLVSHPRIFSSEELRKMGMPSLDRVLAVSTYHDVPLLRKAIHTFKYRRIPGLLEILQKLLADAFLRHMGVRQDACLCPVPLHWSREWERGFNQAEILAAGVAERSELPLWNLLRRTRPTGHQARRSGEERRRAMRGAFRARARARARVGTSVWEFLDRRPSPNPSPSPLPFCVYLVDDLFTTGATLEECAKALKEAGVKRVEGVVLAHG